MQANYPGRRRRWCLSLWAEIDAAPFELVRKEVVQLFTAFGGNGAGRTGGELLTDLVDLALERGHVERAVVRDRGCTLCMASLWR